MKAIILAAGRGSRLGERTKDRPKCMCVLAGRTLLERCMESLHQAGFEDKDIGIVTGYRREMFVQDGITYFHNDNWENTNMFISLTMAEKWLKKEPCLVCYSDIVFSPGAAEALKNSSDDLAVTYYTGFWELWEKRMKDPLLDLETFRLCRDKKHLLEIGRRPSSRQEIEGQYMGLIRFTPKSWEQVQKTISHPLEKPLEKLDMTTLLNAMLKDGCAIGAVPVQDLWLECDTQEDIEVYERFYKDYLI